MGVSVPKHNSLGENIIYESTVTIELIYCYDMNSFKIITKKNEGTSMGHRARICIVFVNKRIIRFTVLDYISHKASA